MNLIDQFVSLYRTCFLNLYSLVKNVIFFTFEGKKIFSTTQEFAEHELVKKGTALKEIYKEFLKKTRLRKDVYLIEYPHPMCFAVGSQFPLSKNSHAAIFMSQGLYQLDPQAFSFLFKHEVAHIKFCDVAMSSVTALIGIVAAAFAASFFLSFGQAAYLSFLLLPAAMYFLGGLWMRYRENRADRFALRHSDADELKGAVRYFTAIKRFNASLSATHPQYTSDGELAKGFHYPKTSARIALFLTEIKKRTGEDYHPDSSLIDQHIELLKANDDRLKSILTPSLS